MNYRHAEFTAGELRIAGGECAGDNAGGEMVVAAGDGGVAAVDGGDGGGVSGGVSGDIVEEAVGHDGVGVGEVEEVVDGEWFAAELLVATAVPLLLRELVPSGAVIATDEVFRHFHFYVYMCTPSKK